MPTTSDRYAIAMSERRTDRDFTYVQLRMPNELHARLTDVATEDDRTIHGELLAVSRMWVQLPHHRRLALLAEVAQPARHSTPQQQPQRRVAEGGTGYAP